jgi:hypothetical protein
MARSPRDITAFPADFARQIGRVDGVQDLSKMALTVLFDEFESLGL